MKLRLVNDKGEPMNFDALNTTGGHIVVCMFVAVMGCVMMWMGRSEPSIFGVGVGLLQTGIGVAFRCMGTPNVQTPSDPTVPPQLPRQ